MQIEGFKISFILDSTPGFIAVMVKLHNVHFSYSNKIVFNQISVEFRKDYFYSVLGSSGQGKSTLLKIIAGYLKPQTGTVEGPKTCGYVLQGGSLFNHLNVKENICIQPAQDHWSRERIDTRLEQLCELTRFPIDLLTKYPDQLSGGQKQRAAIMRALFMDSDLILLDEAFNGLDLILKVELIAELKIIFKNLKKTVIMVTHDLIEARLFADQVVIFEGGCLVENSSCRDFFQSPQSDFGRQLIKANEFGAKIL